MAQQRSGTELAFKKSEKEERNMYAADTFRRPGFGSLIKFLTENYSDFESGESRSWRFPPVNMFASEDGVIVRTQVPGVNPDSISLTIKDDVLKISFKKGEDDIANDGEIWQIKKERPRGEFRRSIRLPYHVKTDEIAAQYDKGILTIRLPRAEQDKPVTIPVHSMN